MKAIAFAILFTSAGVQATNLNSLMSTMGPGDDLHVFRAIPVPAGRDIVYFEHGDNMSRVANGHHVPEFQNTAICWLNVTKREYTRSIPAGTVFSVRRARNLNPPSHLTVLDFELHPEAASFGCKLAGGQNVYPTIGMMQIHIATFIRIE